jgi:hypothetical protein
VSTLREQLAQFHGAITGATPLDRARDLVERGEIDEVERLHVYEHAYTARIASVLVHDYPKLARLVGEAELRSWTADYLRAHPPSNFSLREVGAHLAQWLAKREPKRDEHRDTRQPLLVADLVCDGPNTHPSLLLADLARIERARTEVFDGPDATPLSREDLSAMDPAEFPSLVLRLVPSSRVVSLETNADEVWDAIENEGETAATGVSTCESAIGTAIAADAPVIVERSMATDAPAIVDGPRVVLVWRREITVIHRTLDLDEARIVPMMIAGTTFGAACELLDEATAAERAIELLVRWLDAQILTNARG